MIPEIEDKFKVINWLREQKVKHDVYFMKKSRSEQSKAVNLNYCISELIGKLKSEINEIASRID